MDGRGAPLRVRPSMCGTLCAPAAALCAQMLRELDIAVTHLAPDDWLLCSAACKLDWAERWLAGHLRDAVR